MPSSPKVKRALEHFRRAAASGRMPHALLVSGHPRGTGTEFTEYLLRLLYGDLDAVALRQHADIRWIEPESKSRQIRIDEQIRPLIEFIGLTSYEGGWKAGVILFADRLNDNAQNALLKTLEEPPPRSLLVLVTDTPAALLPTIRSRAQYVEALEDEQPGDTPWLPLVLELLRHPPERRACEMMAWTDRLTAPLRSLKDLATEEETVREETLAKSRGGDEAELTKAGKELVDGRVATRVKEMRAEILRTIQLWQRDVMARTAGAEPTPLNFPGEEGFIAEQAEKLSFPEAAIRVAAVDEVRELLEHNIREAVALPRLARALSKPMLP